MLSLQKKKKEEERKKKCLYYVPQRTHINSCVHIQTEDVFNQSCRDEYQINISEHTILTRWLNIIIFSFRLVKKIRQFYKGCNVYISASVFAILLIEWTTNDRLFSLVVWMNVNSAKSQSPKNCIYQLVHNMQRPQRMTNQIKVWNLSSV